MKKRYFKSVAGNNWVLYATTKEGKVRHLRKCAKTAIKRHIKVIGDANPYDPGWEVYFEEREARKWRTEKGESPKLAMLWREQDGKCPSCTLGITMESQWHAHHLIRRTDGGTDANQNLVLLHPECHRKVHALGIKVTKPALEKGFRKA